MRKSKKTIICILLVVALTALCAVSFTACNDDPDPRYVSSTAKYSFYNNKTSVFDFDLGLIGSMLETVAEISPSDVDASVTLTENGKINMKLHIKSGAKLNDLIQNKLPDLLASFGGEGNFDIDEILSSLDLNSFIETYVSALFPGVTLNDLQGSLGLLQSAMGISFIGMDWNSDSTKSFAETLKETGKLPPLSEFVFGDKGFGLEFNGRYELRNLKDADGTAHKAVCIGLQDIQDDPFLILSMEKDETTDKEVLIGQVKFVKFKLYAERV